MSEKNGNTAGFAGMDQANLEATLQPWMEYWMQLFEQNSQWQQSLMAGAPPNVDYTTLRSQWLGAMSKSVEAFMRSPTFLEGMRRNAETMTAAKVSGDLAKFEMARQAGVPHIEDIRGLYDRLESAHQLVMEKLEGIERRLSAMEQKLNS